MKKQVNLLQGPILPVLTSLALPIMATSFIQMAYNLTDMIWIGKVGSGAVASVGAAGMFMWLSNGLATLAKMGGQVHVAQALGAGKYKDAAYYAQSALQLGILFAIVFGVLSIVFADFMIGFFKLNSPDVIQDAISYLMITCGLVVFSFINQILTGILTAMGNSRISFFANGIGLLLNIILDPIFIFGWGFIPSMGVAGAAIATVLAQFIVMIVFIIAIYRDTIVFIHVHVLKKIHTYHMRNIIKVGLPTAIQSMLFSAISMVIARLIAGWGDGAVAVQKVGSQIEAITWMTSEGFAAALNSFVAQNYGAHQSERIKKGFHIALTLMLGWGVCTSLLLMFAPELVFRIFINETDVIPLGVDYLRILGVSQMFSCMEITTAGLFNGLGRTMPPSVVSVSLNVIRIPLAMLLSANLGLNGVWWAITISCFLKGIVLFGWYIIQQHNSDFLIKQST